MIGDIEDCVGPGNPGPAHHHPPTVLPRALRERRRKKATESKETEVAEVQSFVPGTQAVYVKTWGCSHNTSDGEYMAGMLASAGYTITDSPLAAHLWLLNSCTVKGPAEDGLKNCIRKGRELGKSLVISGCVPQGQKNHSDVLGLSVVGVQQIDRVVEVVEETLKGNTVRLFGQRRSNGHKLGGAPLDLPKIRKNRLIEIIPINTGCLNSCTYCKTKHARGDLGSYQPEQVVDRARQAFQEGVVEVWLTSEDLGAYGHDIGVTLPQLLWQLVRVIPEDCMLRLGMTNPPYIMDHMEEMAAILNHPRVYSFLHVPVQSGSDSVLTEMRREYTVTDFTSLLDYLLKHVPGLSIATDIICGFPSETEDDFEGTMKLVQCYKFPSLFINQFYPRPGTPAARMRRIPTQIVKARSRRLSHLFHSYLPYSGLEGTSSTVLVTDLSSDGRYYVGHDKSYRQVLVPRQEGLMGEMVRVQITSTGKHYLMGEIDHQSLVRLPSPRQPLQRIEDVSMATRPGTMENKSVFMRGQSSLDRMLLAVIVCVVCWLLAQHSGHFITWQTTPT